MFKYMMIVKCQTTCLYHEIFNEANPARLALILSHPSHPLACYSNKSVNVVHVN